MYLSEHFHLTEFTSSQTAERYGLDNTPDTNVINNLTHLCVEVLEPLRRHLCQPVVICSGYRSKQVNKLVGGVRTSQHLTGEAADIAMPRRDAQGKPLTHAASLSLLQEWMSWIIENTDFDQCILEHTKKGDYWIHVSHTTGRNRHCVIPNILKK
ncbi:MAG: D-Ala-D-Ala carboxypeptidase family metallohydrolase [Prevotellaceae bacterium]|nr:D-Ala-D-Ala carboxypeptidase family metallohydrolase [Prevotellaceae bacterium]